MKTQLIKKHFEGAYFGKKDTFLKIKKLFTKNFPEKMELGIADLGIETTTGDIIIAFGFTGDYDGKANCNGIYLLLLHNNSRQIYLTPLGDQCGALNDTLCDLLEQYVTIPVTKICELCKKEFRTDQGRARFCCEKHRRAAARKRAERKIPASAVARPTTQPISMEKFAVSR